MGESPCGATVSCATAAMAPAIAGTLTEGRCAPRVAVAAVEAVVGTTTGGSGRLWVAASRFPLRFRHPPPSLIDFLSLDVNSQKKKEKHRVVVQHRRRRRSDGLVEGRVLYAAYRYATPAYPDSASTDARRNSAKSASPRAESWILLPSPPVF